MTDFPHQEFTMVVKGDVVFVKLKETGRTVGVWKSGEYYKYSTEKSKKQKIRNNCDKGR